jgi:hypothetical protein
MPYFTQVRMRATSVAGIASSLGVAGLGVDWMTSLRTGGDAVGDTSHRCAESFAGFSVTGGFGSNSASAARRACARPSRSSQGYARSSVLAGVYTPAFE